MPNGNYQNCHCKRVVTVNGIAVTIMSPPPDGGHPPAERGLERATRQSPLPLPFPPLWQLHVESHLAHLVRALFPQRPPLPRLRRNKETTIMQWLPGRQCHVQLGGFHSLYRHSKGTGGGESLKRLREFRCMNQFGIQMQTRGREMKTCVNQSVYDSFKKPKFTALLLANF